MGRRAAAVLGAIVVGWLVGVAIAGAQTVINPTRVQFESPDHNAVLADGQAAITRYELRMFLEGAAEPISATDLGKPASATSLITATPAVLIGTPVGQVFTVKVAAIGPAGISESEGSNPFTRALPPRAPLKPMVLP